MKDRHILLSFDLEEFDMPLEYGHQVPFEKQLEASDLGMKAILPVLNTHNIPSTFFTTANYANHRKELVKELAAKNEIASHTYYHTEFEESHLALSKKTLEEITGRPVEGLRMPRMRPVPVQAKKEAQYLYDSSINPTWLPGRYNNLHLPRTLYKDEGLIIVPASVTPTFRLPLFWLMFKNIPLSLYTSFCKTTLRKDGYINLYYHPWEFTNLNEYKIPGYTKKADGERLTSMLDKLINSLKQEGTFITTVDFVKANSNTV